MDKSRTDRLTVIVVFAVAGAVGRALGMVRLYVETKLIRIASQGVCCR
jgi:hypothetical protein